MAAYCARAGIRCEIFVPRRITLPRKVDDPAHGARSVLPVVPGEAGTALQEVCRAKVERRASSTNHVTQTLLLQRTEARASMRVYEQLGHLPENLSSSPSATGRCSSRSSAPWAPAERPSPGCWSNPVPAQAALQATAPPLPG